MKRFIISFLSSFVIYLSLFVLVVWLIPQKDIKEQTKNSAEYLNDLELFPNIKDGMFNTKQDNYADSILLNILYYLDLSEPIISILESRYYRDFELEVNENLLKAVSVNPTSNLEYSRYWHGSIVIIRPLLILMNIKQIRSLLFFTVVIILAICIALLFKIKKMKGYAWCLLVGCIVIKIWMLAYSLEYVMSFLIMSVTLLAVLINHSYKNKEDITSSIFVVAGVSTCFVDFLTTETLPFTVPMLTLIILSSKDGTFISCSSSLKKVIKYGIEFGLSYTLMFLAKWLLGALFLGSNILKDALSSVMERTVGEVHIGQTSLSPRITTFQKISGAIWRNIGCLYPFKNSISLKMVVLIFIITCLFIFSFIYLFHINYYLELGLVIGFISLIPILRFLILSNHSYIHYFFTYRSLLVFVIGILYYIWICCKGYFIRRSDD